MIDDGMKKEDPPEKLECPCQNKFEFLEFWNIPQFHFTILSGHSRICGNPWGVNKLVP